MPSADIPALPSPAATASGNDGSGGTAGSGGTGGSGGSGDPGRSGGAGTTYVLRATNASTVSGEQYFSVFPRPLVGLAPQQQTTVPLVSPPTVAGGRGGTAAASLSWQGGADALSLVVAGPSQPVRAAPRTPVSLGSTMAVAWQDGSVSVTQTASGSGSSVTVTFGADVPSGARVGLVVGPGPVMVPVPVPASGASLVLTPDLTAAVKVVFGTPCRAARPAVRNVSRAATVFFNGTEAAIAVGPNNLITQTS